MVQKYAVDHLRLVVYPVIYKVLYIRGGAGFLNHQQYLSIALALGPSQENTPSTPYTEHQWIPNHWTSNLNMCAWYLELLLDSTKSAASDGWLSKDANGSLVLQCEISWVTFPKGLITTNPNPPNPPRSRVSEPLAVPSARSWHSRLWILRCSMQCVRKYLRLNLNRERERWPIPKLHLTFYDKQSLIYGNSANTDQEGTIWKNSTPKTLAQTPTTINAPCNPSLPETHCST